MEIEYFSNFSVKHLMVIKANALTLISIQYFKPFLTSFLSFCFYYTVIKFFMIFFSIPIYMFFETRVLFNNILCSLVLFHNQTNFSYIFSIFIVYLLYHIRLIRLSGDIELNPGPKPRRKVLKKKANSLTHSSQSNALILRLEAVYRPNYCVEQMNP